MSGILSSMSDNSGRFDRSLGSASVVDRGGVRRQGSRPPSPIIPPHVPRQYAKSAEGTPVEVLERVAAERGWRLRWNERAVLGALQRVALDIWRGKLLVTAHGPFWVMTSGVNGREFVAREVLLALGGR